MKFEIASSDLTFNGKGFNSFFLAINQACKRFGVNYFVVGAFARDIILENIYGQPTGIATRDIDIAITIENWERYNQLVDCLINQYNFREGKNKHEYISPENIFTDIIPYGLIEKNRKINFPPHFNRVMNMLGFREVYDSTIQIVLDHTVELKLASIEGIALLKFIAWMDRVPDSISQKHARDISLIIDAYFDAKVAEFAVEFPDLFDEDNFDSYVCGARVLGKRFNKISQNSTALKVGLNEIFDYILKEENNSLFLTQLTNVTNWKYTFCLRLIKNLVLGFRETQ